MSLFGCAASSNHRGQWCLTSPRERTRWQHDSVCLVCREDLWKVMTLVQGWENPMSLKWLGTEDLRDSPFTSWCTGVTSSPALARVCTIRFEIQSPHTFLLGLPLTTQPTALLADIAGCDCAAVTALPLQGTQSRLRSRLISTWTVNSPYLKLYIFCLRGDTLMQ